MGLKKTSKKILAVIFILLLVVSTTGFYLYKSKATSIKSAFFINLENTDNIETLTQKLTNECGLKYPSIFLKISQRMNLEHWMKRGRYEIKPSMTIVDIVRVFRAGKSQTVNLTIKGVSTLEKFALNCGEKLEPDAQDFLYLLSDSTFLDSLGFNTQTVYSLLIPDTYNTYWHTQPDELLKRLKVEYNKYWTEERIQKAKVCGLTLLQVSTLASIVCKETSKPDDMPIVAGLYLNRIKTNMPLQADPTVIFAQNDGSIRRVTNAHLQIASLYNTYRNVGLPPGPICIPSKQAIEAVLNYTKHNYIFMCAKEDFSGYHNFAVTYAEHLLNAKHYQAALDRKAIK